MTCDSALKDSGYVLSKHAEDRCIERGILERKVFETIFYGICTNLYGERERVTHEHRKHRLVVVAAGFLIVTVYRANNKNPKRHTRKIKTGRKRQTHRLIREWGRRAIYEIPNKARMFYDEQSYRRSADARRVY